MNDDVQLIETLTVSHEAEGQRLDVFICESLSVSRNYTQSLIKEKLVDVDGKNKNANYKVKAGNIVTVKINPPTKADILPENIPLDIFYEDEFLLVVNKPKGMVVHPSPGHFEGTLVNALMFHCGESLSAINGVMRPGIVHRIDMDTSGLLVVAKTNEVHKHLSEQLADHSMTREYLALVHGNIKEDKGTINKPIGRHHIDRKKMAVREGGREAVTHYTVLERFGKFTLLSLKLETGRTHQIRVHMTSINHPLVGDYVYTTTKETLGFVGQALHATTLGFIHPITNEYIEFNASLPSAFAETLKTLKEK